jgi:hypothetical protein
MNNYEELRARVEALEAQAGNLKGSLTSSTPTPVATDEELRKIYNNPTHSHLVGLRNIYNLGIEHGQASSREMAEPAPVAGEMAVLVADLRRMAAYATAACRFSDGETLTSAANMLQRLSEQLPEKDGVPAPVAGGLVERVAMAIHPDRCADPNLYLHEARAAILEVASWLRERDWVDMPYRLEQEAGR